MGIETVLGSKDKGVFMDYAHYNADKYNLHEKPFDYTEDMIEKCWELIVDKHNYKSIWNANKNCEWVYNNIRPYGDRNTTIYRSASETFEDMMGECVDRSFLLITMNNLMGMNAGFVSVMKTYDGRTNPHVCTYIKDFDEGFVLLDPALYGYDPKHKQYAVYDREMAKRFYNTYCMAFNRRDTEDFERYINEFDNLDRRLNGMPEVNMQQSFGNSIQQNNQYQNTNNYSGTPFFTASNALMAIGGAIAIRVFFPDFFEAFSEYVNIFK